jgi:DNA-binding XRE family transcriptional regulator
MLGFARTETHVPSQQIVGTTFPMSGIQHRPAADPGLNTRRRPASSEQQDFAARLIALRKAYGREIGDPAITKGRFARLLDLAEETYRSYETGRTEPSLQVLIRIRRLTGVNLNSLVAGEIDRAA